MLLPSPIKWSFRYTGVLRFSPIVGVLVVALAVTQWLPAQNIPVTSPLFTLPSGIKPAARAALVGDAVCSSCHQERAATYFRTAHARTSSLSSVETVHGKFNPGSNVFRTVKPDLFFRMEADGENFFQTGVLLAAPDKEITCRKRIDIIVGSGRKGQTFLYWNNDELYQLPISYWAELGEWIYSPGYVNGTAPFNRPILQRCLECHAGSFKALTSSVNAYDRSSLVLGISCEKCHGPGGEHVDRYRAPKPPQSLADAAIINPAKLSRERQIDVCSLCHSGPGESLTPPQSYTPGDVLANHLTFPPIAPGSHIDVHVSQVQMLARSRCFLSSPKMTCLTCHDVHKPERDLAVFASVCLTCHQVKDCRIFPKQGTQIATQCVACHMPLEVTEQIIISGDNGKKLQPKVRNHQIAIYPEVHLP